MPRSILGMEDFIVFTFLHGHGQISLSRLLLGDRIGIALLIDEADVVVPILRLASRVVIATLPNNASVSFLLTDPGLFRHGGLATLHDMGGVAFTGLKDRG